MQFRSMFCRSIRLQNHACVYMHNVIIKQISNNKINGIHNKVKERKKIKQLDIYIYIYILS